jgi:hypothetical protein
MNSQRSSSGKHRLKMDKGQIEQLQKVHKCGPQPQPTTKKVNKKQFRDS